MLAKMPMVKRRWFVLAAACLINLCIGCIYAWSVFANPMAAYLSEVTGTKVTSLAICFTIANSVGPITMISGGFLIRKLGPRWLIIIGGAMYGAGLILSGFAKSVGMLIFTYGIIYGLGLGVVYGCTVSNTVAFFPDKKGFAGGITTGTYGLSSVLVPPIANALIDKVSVTSAFKILGAVMLVVILICSLFIIKCPDDLDIKGSAKKATNVNVVNKNWLGMLKSFYFYPMLIMLLCGGFAGLMITSQASPMAQFILKFTPAQAAVIVSVLALFNAGGRLISGVISDKLGQRMTLRIIFMVLAIGLIFLFLPLQSRVVTFFIGVMITGFCFGSIMGIFPAFTTAQFGPKYNGMNYGIMFVGFAIAGFLGPMITSNLLRSTGTYQVSFLISAALALFGFGLTFIKSER